MKSRTEDRFIIRTNKRLVLSITAVLTIAAPAVIWGVNKVSNSDDTYALTYAIPSGYTTITDANFYDCVATEFKKEFPSEEIPSTGLTNTQLGKITTLKCNSNVSANTMTNPIYNAAGLEKMTALTTLNLSVNGLNAIDVSKNTALETFSIYSNNLSSLDVSSNTKLKNLSVNFNNITSLDISKNTALESLYVNNNKITSLNVSKNTALKELAVGNNLLNSFDVSKNTALTTLYINTNNLTSIDISKNTLLTFLGAYNNKLSSIDVSHNTAMKSLYLYNNQLTSIDVSHNPNLVNLGVENNRLTNLDVSNNNALTKLTADNILVQANISPVSGSTQDYSFANVKFLQDSQSINNTDNYSYNAITKKLTVNNYAGTNGYVQVSSTENHLTYKLKINEINNPDANPGDDSDNDTKPDEKNDSEDNTSNDDTVPVPNTSIGKITPNTGANTNTEPNNTSTTLFFVVPLAIVFMILYLAYNKNKNHRRF